MTYATVEVATLADAVLKASRFAPTKGTALDRAAGIVLELASGSLTVRATNLESTFLQRMPTADHEGITTWRVNSNLLSSIVGKLPMNLGGLVTLEAKPGDIWLHAETEGVSAKMRLFDDELAYPMWDAFDPTLLKPVEEFAARVNQIAWAAQDKGDLLTGVHIDGGHLTATDATSVARVPLVVPVEAPITCQVQGLAWLLKTHPEVHLKAETDHLQIALDQDTQVTLRLFLGAYPDFGPFMNKESFPHAVHLERDKTIDAINRCWAPFEDKFPILHFHLTGTELSLSMEDQEVGQVEQHLPVETDAPIMLKLTPGPLREMLTGARQQDIVFRHIGDSLKAIMVDDQLDYTAVTMPRAVK